MDKKSLITSLITLSAFALAGCMSAAVNRTFQKPEEVAANDRAEWVPITKNQYGTVYFDPYQLTFLSKNTFRAPAKVPISATASGNWVYELNCDNTSGKVIGTLGGTPTPQNMDFPPGSVGYIAKEKICGKTFYNKPYGFISADSSQNEFYYSKNEVARNSRIANIYRFDILTLGQSGNSWSTGQIEINCKDSISRPVDTVQWQRPPKRSPANVLLYQFCPKSSQITKTYIPGEVQSAQTSKDSSLADYLTKLNNSSKPDRAPEHKPPTAKSAEPSGLPSGAKNDFDWQKLYKN
ncbi:hypothetical protein ICN30_00885 [Polynucleobacter sp. 31A-FELB]|uniref:hypothetical protein n=1 Tax=Polynucleobacter sp. 31A-FELB TaxID=2689096 RepID=UPI001C0DE155|nr:hypothetical protein [Polynucleobacter sp. 31A-FELB]MBU3586387.1 hypothetical protein [Polynucleobacter sp. 31A-FELB]